MQRALILDFNTTTQIATCIDRNTHYVFKIKLEDDSQPSKGMFLHLENVFLNENEEVTTLRSDEYQLKEAEIDDCIHKTREGVVIRSWIGFSSNPKHLTSSRKIGYTDWYGLVDCSGYQIPLPGVYTADIIVNDINFKKNGNCLFRLGSQPRQRRRTDHHFLEKMEEFERKIAYQNEQDVHLQTELEMNESQVEAIVLRVDQANNSAVCFSKPLESPIFVKLPKDTQVKKGQVISFSDHDYRDETYIPGSKPDSIKIEEDVSIRYENNEMILSSLAAVSSTKERNPQKNGVAFAGCYGLVQISEDHLNLMESDVAYKVELIPYFAEENSRNPSFAVARVIERVPVEESGDFLLELFKHGEKNKISVNQRSDDEFVTVSSSPTNEDIESSSPAESAGSFSLLSELSSTDRQQQQGSAENLPTNNSTSQEELNHQTNSTDWTDSSNCPNPQLKRTAMESESRENQEEVLVKERPTETATTKPTESANRSSTSYKASSEYSSNSSSTNYVEKRMDSAKPASGGMEPKTDVENCVLILRIDDNVIVGYETTLLKLMKISIRNINDRLYNWDTLRFISNYSENGVICVRDGTASVSKTAGVEDPGFKPIRIEAKVIFSSNRKHRTYSQRIAFSDRFGWVEIPETIERYGEMVLYKTYVEIKQIENDALPVFVAVTVLQEVADCGQVDLMTSAMSDYEERLLKEDRTYGLSSRGLSNYALAREPRPRNSQKSKYKESRFNIEGSHKGIVISTKANKNGKYGEILTSFGSAVFTSRPTVKGTGENVNEGSWLLVRFEEKNNRLLVKQISEIVDGLDTHLVERNIPTVYASISFSNKTDQIDEYRLYAHTLFGFVQVHRRVYEHHENQTIPVHVVWLGSDGRRNSWERPVFWEAELIPSYSRNEDQRCAYSSPRGEQLKNQHRNYSSNRSDEMQKFAEHNGYNLQYSPGRPHRGEEKRQNQYRSPNRNGYSDNQCSSNFNQSKPFSPVPSQYSETDNQGNFPIQPRMSSVSNGNVSNNSRLPTSMALATSRRQNWMIVYLEDINKPAIMFCQYFPKSVRLGSRFLCKYRPINISEQTHNVLFEVTDIIKMEEPKHDTKVDKNECFSLFEINLFYMDPKFKDYPDMSGQYVVCSKDVGYVVLNDKVRDKSDNLVTAESIVRKYKDKEYASRLVGWCKYVESRVPRVMDDYQHLGDEEITTYVWRIIQVLSTKEHYEQNQKELRQENLGFDSHHIEVDDDISRQKKAAQAEDELKQRRMGNRSSSAMDSSYTDRDSSSYGGYATPRESVHNMRVDSSQSYPATYGNTFGNQGPSSSSQWSQNVREQQPDSMRNRTPTNQPGEIDIRRHVSMLRGHLNIFLKNAEIRNEMMNYSPKDFNGLTEAMELIKRDSDEYYNRHN